MASSKKKKKNMVTLLSLFAVLILLIAAYVVATKWKDQESKKEAEEGGDEGVLLASVPTSEIAAIQITDDLYSCTIAQEQNAWAMQGDEEFPLDTAAVDTMAEHLQDFRATRLVLPDAPDLSEYGLSEPVLSVQVQKTDGTLLTLNIGDQSSADGGYYTCVGGTKDIYLVEADVRDCFYLPQTKLMRLDTVPTFLAEDAVGLKVTSDTYPSFTIQDSTQDLKDLTAMALYTMALYGAYEKPVRVDLTNFSTLMENYTAISLGELVAYHAADAPAYGLSAPADALTVWYTQTEEDGTEQTQEFTVYFGNPSEDGTGVYVRLEGSNQIFLMPAATKEVLLAPDTFSALSKYTQMVNITTISGLHAAYGDTTRVFEITHETEEQESGGTSTTDHFTVDGKALNDAEESDAFRDLYQAVIAIRLTEKLPDSAQVGADAVLTLTFFENDTNEVLHEVRYLPVGGDAKHYAIEENGTCIFMADAAAVDALVAQLKEYQP